MSISRRAGGRTRRFALLGALPLLVGCGLAARDKLEAGVYRLDASRAAKSLVATFARERGGRLHVDGRLVGAQYQTYFPGQVEVVLVSPDGATLAAARAHLVHAHYERASRGHADFYVVFDHVPPTGTVIRVCPLLTQKALRDGCGVRPAAKAP